MKKGKDALSSIQNYIFDFDGTLLDSGEAWKSLDTNFLIKHGREVPADLKQRMEVLTLTDAAHYFAEQFDLSMTAEEIIREWDADISQQYANTIAFKPGVYEFLEGLQRRRAKMCIATMTRRNYADSALRRLKGERFFKFILTAGEFGSGEDKPDIFLECARIFGAEPGTCVVFEDSLYAARTAKKAGFHVVGVLDDMSTVAEMKQTCDFTITQFKELL